MVPAQGRRALADPAALPPARHRRRAAATGSARGCGSSARARWSSLLLGRERDDPWDPDRLVWPLLEVIDASLDEPWCATLAAPPRPRARGRRGRCCGATAATPSPAGWPASSRRTPCSGRALVTDWREGRDTDGAGGRARRRPALAGRAVAAAASRGSTSPRPTSGTPRRWPGCGPAARASTLPARLSLFGHTRLPVTEVELLRALGEYRDVHLWLPQPSPRAAGTTWPASAASVAARRRRLRRAGPATRCSPRSAATPASCAGRSTGGRGATSASDALETPHRAGADDPARLAPARPARQRTRPTPPSRAARVHDADDRSVQVHACHGPARQVDVLREVLVGLLAGRPDAGAARHPRDVPGHRDLRAADLGRRSGWPTSSPRAATRRTGCGSGSPTARSPAPTRCWPSPPRWSSSPAAGSPPREVLDLAGGRPGPRAGSGSPTTTSARITDWVTDAPASAGGSTPSTRGAFSHGAVRAQHLAGRPRPDPARRRDERRRPPPPRPRCCRSTTSAATTSTSPAGSPSWSTGSSAASTRWPTRPAVGEWMTALRDGVPRLTDVAARRRLAGAAVRARAGPRRRQRRRRRRRSRSGSPTSARCSTSRLGGRPTRANFRTGTLTVCTMVPMRSVPHRVVCLVGLDDGVFPRTGSVDGDDVLARRPLTGERDPRSEDRQLLLDAVLAATETLVITYTGANEHSGARPPTGRAARRAPRRRSTAPPLRRSATRCWSGTRSSRTTPATSAGRLAGARPFSFDRGRAGRRAAAAASAQPASAVPDRAAAGSATPSDVVAGRPQGVPHPPGPGVPPQRLDVADAARGRRGRRRDPGRPRRARAVGRRRPAAPRGAGRPGPDRGDDRRAAARRAAARRPRHPLPHDRRPRSARSSSPAPPSSATAPPAASTSTSTSGTAGGSPAPSRRLRQPDRHARLLPAQGPPAAALLGRPARAHRRRTPTSPGPRHAVGRDRAGPEAGARRARSTTGRSTGCASWSSCATAGCASRCRCR